jgi:hypothetical protein
MPSSRASPSGARGLGHVVPLAGIVMVVAVITAAAACFAADEAQKLLDTAQEYVNAGEPDNARVLYQQVIEQYPGTKHAGHAHLGLAKIQIAARENEAALATLDKILAEFSAAELVGWAAAEKVSLLSNRFQDYEAAIQAGEEYLTTLGEVLWPLDRAKLVIQLTYAYDKAGQPEQGLTIYNEQLFNTPRLLTHTLFYERMFELHIKTGKPDEALSTARAAYALCDFEQSAIEAMSNLVKKAFTATGDIFKATQFFAAQEDPEKPNPLLEVPMPEVTEEQLAQLLTACGADPYFRAHAYLYAANYKEGMLAAQEALTEAPAEKMMRALNEVARVLKAKDLNLIRANQFLNYAKTGEGENPLAGFWEEAE